MNPDPKYLCSVNGQTCGPFSFAEVEAQVQSGQLSGENFVWIERSGEWLLISQFLQSHRPAAPASLTVQPPAPALNAPPPIQPAAPPSHPMAVASGALGPPVLHEISPARLGKFMGMMPEAGLAVAACRAYRDTSFIFIIIPLWFNLHWSYIVFAERCVGVGDRTLWMGCKDIGVIGYEYIEAITFVEENRMLGNIYSVVIDIYGEESVVLNPIFKDTHQFLVSQIPRLRQLHPNVHATTID